MNVAGVEREAIGALEFEAVGTTAIEIAVDNHIPPAACYADDATLTIAALGMADGKVAHRTLVAVDKAQAEGVARINHDARVLLTLDDELLHVDKRQLTAVEHLLADHRLATTCHATRNVRHPHLIAGAEAALVVKYRREIDFRILGHQHVTVGAKGIEELLGGIDADIVIVLVLDVLAKAAGVCRSRHLYVSSRTAQLLLIKFGTVPLHQYLHLLLGMDGGHDVLTGLWQGVGYFWPDVNTGTEFGVQGLRHSFCLVVVSIELQSGELHGHGLPLLYAATVHTQELVLAVLAVPVTELSIAIGIGRVALVVADKAVFHIDSKGSAVAQCLALLAGLPVFPDAFDHFFIVFL